MTKPVRMQRKRTKGYDMQAASRALNGLPAKYVGRPSKWGNPFELGYHITDILVLYEGWIKRPQDFIPGGSYCREGIKQNPPTIDEVRSELRGHNLVCWCPLDEPCHGDVLLELAND